MGGDDHGLGWEAEATEDRELYSRMGWEDGGMESACPRCDSRAGYRCLEGEDAVGRLVECDNCRHVYRLTYGCFRPKRKQENTWR